MTDYWTEPDRTLLNEPEGALVRKERVVWIMVGARVVMLRPSVRDIASGLRNLYEVKLNGVVLGRMEREYETPRVWTAVLGEVRRGFKTRQDAVEFLVRESGR